MASPAHNLEHAYNMLDPRKAVAPEEVPALFVERPVSPTAEILQKLKVSREPHKFLFIGHRGAGKSSELSYLSTRLGEKYLCIPIPLWTIYGGPSVSHTEVLLAMILRLLQAATDEKLVPRGIVNQIWEDGVRALYRTLSEWFSGPAPPVPKAEIKEITVTLNAQVVELESKIGIESKTRQQVREYLQNRLSELLQRIGDLVLMLQTKLNRTVLLFVEDLDKFNLDDTKDLFLQHAATLTSPRAHVIYTFPVGMRYLGEFHQIRQSFNDAYLLPNIALKHRDGTPDSLGHEKVRKLLLNRVSPELFVEGVVERTVELSGGHARTLIQLAQNAVIHALVDESDRVELQHLTKAASKIRDTFITYLSRDQIKLLRQHRDDPEKKLGDMNDERQTLLLYNGSLLEYGNTIGPWADVNPIVNEILDRYAD